MNTARGARLSPAAAAALRDTAKIVGWGLVLYGAVAVVGAYFAHNPTGAAAVQAVVAELGAGRLAIAWSDPHGPIPTTGAIARRAGLGALLGIGTAATVTACGFLTHALTVTPNAPVVSMLGVGLLLSGLAAMRDELLLRGVILRGLVHAAPPWVALGVCGLAGAAARLGTAGSAGLPILDALVSGLLAVAFAALWRRDRGAWLPWGAHTAWAWTTGPAIRGGILDVRWTAGVWGGGDSGIDGSGAAASVLLVATLAALLWSNGQNRRLSDTIGSNGTRH